VSGTRFSMSSVVRTITAPGRTVEETVTAGATPATTAPEAGGQALNDAGFARMRAGDYGGALPLLEQAVQKLSGTGLLAEAYSDYNLAYTRLALGKCTDVVRLLTEAQAIEGHRKEIDHLRKQVGKRC